ncbi:Uncharacterised protein [Streptococcus pneumoniae]|nr:Uncharacterised protein [Streptococcus pneumoniae]COG10729.1 Uncharacterised protein [Streptococcus pneumoniae]
MESYIHERFFYDDTVLQKSADESATAHSGESTKSANRDDPDDGANDQRRVKLYKAEAKRDDMVTAKT